MELLKKVFPCACRGAAKAVRPLVISILIHVGISLTWTILASVLTFLLGDRIAWLTGLVGALVGLYATGGIIIAILYFLDVLKQ